VSFFSASWFCILASKNQSNRSSFDDSQSTTDTCQLDSNRVVSASSLEDEDCRSDGISTSRIRSKSMKHTSATARDFSRDGSSSSRRGRYSEQIVSKSRMERCHSSDPYMWLNVKSRLDTNGGMLCYVSREFCSSQKFDYSCIEAKVSSFREAYGQRKDGMVSLRKQRVWNRLKKEWFYWGV